MSSIIHKIRKDLKHEAAEKTKRTGQSFFREQVLFYGVRTSIVGKIGKEYLEEIKEKSKAEIFDLCEEFWNSGYLEETFIACNWSYFAREHYKPRDFLVFERVGSMSTFLTGLLVTLFATIP